LYAANQDACLVRDGKRYYVGAAHFQFLARREVLQRVLPLPSQRPMGQVRSLDIAVDQLGLLRLSTPEWWVEHLGNTLQGSVTAATANQDGAVRPAERHVGQVRNWKPARRALLWLHDRTFDLLYRN
jgi:hypothetical protein